MENFYAAPSPPEPAAHVREAIEWARTNRGPRSARVVLISAWNEHDEGGWPCPTSRPEGQLDDSLLRAMAEALRQATPFAPAGR